MTFSPNLTFGDLLQAGVLLAGVLGSFYALKGQLKEVAFQLRQIAKVVENHEHDLDRHRQNLADLNAAVFPHKRGRAN